jgi:hypothetical protein
MSNCAWCLAEFDPDDAVCPACGQPTRLTPPTIQEMAAKRAASPRPAIGRKRFWDGATFEWAVLHPLDLVVTSFTDWLQFAAAVLASLFGGLLYGVGALLEKASGRRRGSGGGRSRGTRSGTS